MLIWSAGPPLGRTLINPAVGCKPYDCGRTSRDVPAPPPGLSCLTIGCFILDINAGIFIRIYSTIVPVGSKLALCLFVFFSLKIRPKISFWRCERRKIPLDGGLGGNLGHSINRRRDYPDSSNPHIWQQPMEANKQTNNADAIWVWLLTLESFKETTLVGS